MTELDRVANLAQSMKKADGELTKAVRASEVRLSPAGGNCGIAKAIVNRAGMLEISRGTERAKVELSAHEARRLLYELRHRYGLEALAPPKVPKKGGE